jgi:hypothetical protein
MPLEEELNDGVVNDAPAAEDTRSIIDRAVDAQLEKAGEGDAPTTGAEIDEQKAKRFSQAEREDAARKAREASRTPSADKGRQAPSVDGQPQAPALRAPVGWSPAARAAFDKLPPEVRDAVAKREQEVNEGFRTLQDYKGLDAYKGYIDMARQRDPNVSFGSVFKNAVEWEASLQNNPENTVRHLIGLAAQLRGMHPQQFVQRLLGGQQQAQQPQPGLTFQQAQEIARQEYAQQSAQRDSLYAVEKFMTDPANVHGESVAETMASLIERGLAHDLQGAYDMACWTNPEIRAQLVNQRRAPGLASDAKAQQIARSKAAAKATVGAPRQGSPPTSRRDTPTTVRGAIDAAVAAQLGEL